MAYFCEPVPVYQTRGVAEAVHPFIIMKCIEMLNDLKKQIENPDYLQIYSFWVEPGTKAFHIKHTQEVPKYNNEISILLPSGVNPYEGKIYFIDDVTHRTFTTPEER